MTAALASPSVTGTVERSSTLHVHLHDVCMNSAHPCFRCKMYIWRSEGRSHFAKMPEGWRGPSVRERARRQVAEAKAAGLEIESAKGYYGSRA